MPEPSDREHRASEDQGLSGLAEAYQKAAPYLAASSTLIASLLGFLALGYWLDRKLGHTTPWFLLLGAMIGMVGGFISFFRTVFRIGKRK